MANTKVKFIDATEGLAESMGTTVQSVVEEKEKFFDTIAPINLKGVGVKDWKYLLVTDTLKLAQETLSDETLLFIASSAISEELVQRAKMLSLLEAPKEIQIDVAERNLKELNELEEVEGFAPSPSGKLFFENILKNAKGDDDKIEDEDIKDILEEFTKKRG